MCTISDILNFRCLLSDILQESCYERHRFGNSTPECDLYSICRPRHSSGAKGIVNDWQEPYLFIIDSREMAFHGY